VFYELQRKVQGIFKNRFSKSTVSKTLSGFETLIGLGSQLRQIHLLESQLTDNYIIKYPIDEDNIVVKPKLHLTGFENLSGLGNVYINETQYFENVPEVAWNFYIGGYQPAQKWLKDRKDRELSTEDIFHYQKIIVALSETDRLMKEIDEIEIE
jgi:Type ISP C-terminal specificity domain